MSRWFLRLCCMKTPSAEPPPVPPSSAVQRFIFFVFTFSSVCVSAPEQRGVSWGSSQRLARRLFYGCCFLMYRLYTDRVMRWWWGGGVFVEECVERGGVPLQQGSRQGGRSSGPDWTCPTVTFLSLFPPHSCWRSTGVFGLFFFFDTPPQRIQRKMIKNPQNECCDGPRDAEWIIPAAKNRNLTHREEPHHTWASHTCSPHSLPPHPPVLKRRWWMWGDGFGEGVGLGFVRNVLSGVSRIMRCEWRNEETHVVKPERSVGLSQFWFTTCIQATFFHQSRRLSWEKSLIYILYVKMYIYTNYILKNTVKSGRREFGF